MEAPTAWQQVHRPPHGAKTVVDSDYELPSNYDEDQVTLLVRDPECVFAFWEVTDAGWQRAIARLPHGDATPDLVLRVYDLDPTAEWDSAHGRGFSDFPVANTAGWYVHTDAPGLVLGAEIGAKRDGTFISIARSSAVATPPGRVSDDTDVDWMTVEELYRMVAQMPVGASSPAVRAVLSRRREVELSSGLMIAMGEPGFSPGFSPGFHRRSAPAARATFRTVPRHELGQHELHLEADVVLSGRVSHPSATITINGQPVPVQEDGHFRLQLPLPDGTHVLPVEARFADGARRALTPVISRETF